MSTWQLGNLAAWQIAKWSQQCNLTGTFTMTESNRKSVLHFKAAKRFHALSQRAEYRERIQSYQSYSWYHLLLAAASASGEFIHDNYYETIQ